MEAQAESCGNCCGYPQQEVPRVEQRFQKSNESTPATKLTAATAATKASGVVSRLMLESTRVDPFSAQSRVEFPVLKQSISMVPLHRAISPDFRQSDMQIRRRRLNCQVLQQRYHGKQKAYSEKLAALRREFLQLIEDYKQKMIALEGIEQRVLAWERSRSRRPLLNRSLSVMQLHR